MKSSTNINYYDACTLVFAAARNLSYEFQKHQFTSINGLLFWQDIFKYGSDEYIRSRSLAFFGAFEFVCKLLGR